MASGKKYYYLKDHLGSTRSVIDDNQNTVAEQTMYDSYGKLDNITLSSADPAREKFTGKEFDEDGADDENITGGMKLFYFGARYYDPEIGLWTSTDPKEQFWSLYSYGHNPISGTDPDGRWFDEKKITPEQELQMAKIALSGNYDDLQTLLDAIYAEKEINPEIVHYITNGYRDALDLPIYFGDEMSLVSFTTQLGLIYGWPYAHVATNTLLTHSDIGSSGAWVLSLGKEFVDVAAGILLERNGNLFSGFQPMDFRMNKIGRYLGKQMQNPVPGQTFKSILAPYEFTKEGLPGPFYPRVKFGGSSLEM